jgi:hypothetical protein
MRQRFESNSARERSRFATAACERYSSGLYVWPSGSCFGRYYSRYVSNMEGSSTRHVRARDGGAVKAPKIRRS